MSLGRISPIFAIVAMSLSLWKLILDFGKINIISNGDVYANVNHPILGSIYTHSIVEIVQYELDEGKSWLRVRDQNPCNTCVYQWLCPSPSDYELFIGRSNLCHVIK